jgi:N-dimethylarginine dimethylaminohydrolase
MHEAFGLRLTYVFPLAPGEYHTNVVLAVLAGRACVLHADSLGRGAAAAIAEVYGEAAILLDDAEKAAFAGNCIALGDDEVWMSARAEAALRPATRAALEAAGFGVRSVQLDEIEQAGGSLRCCVCELY